MTQTHFQEKLVKIQTEQVTLNGNLNIRDNALGVVLFAHGSGSSRHSPRNRYVAEVLNTAGFATLLLDLLTAEEEAVDQHTRHLRFDISFLAQRLLAATDWLNQNPDLKALKIGYFGASTGAGAALMAAAEHPHHLAAVVSRGGRPDLAGAALPEVSTPTLMIVGGNDVPVIGMNENARAKMTAETKLEIVPSATHLFEEPGTLETVAKLAADWFKEHLR
jgi:putative phosphoribosyl transferase